MTIKQRFDAILERFAERMPAPDTELQYRNPYELLVAVILSAQCTDKRVNMVTPAIFEAFPTVHDMARADFDTLHPYITSVNYHNNKTRSLLGMAREVVERFNGEVPTDIDSLTSLPGVGRKTANVMLAVAFQKAAMPVDTHVFRVSERLGLTTGSKSPLQTEKQLTDHIPPELLSRAHHWLILHGRYVCKARKPECLDCFMSDLCKFYSKN